MGMDNQNWVNYIIINIGSDNGIKIDMPVMTENKLLIGKVIEADNKFSKISTIFNPSMKVAIKTQESEAFGIVYVEAMACGLPVICTPNTGGEDVIREGLDGFILPIRDVKALEERILYLFEHPEDSRVMGLAAKERVESGFTWDDYGEKVISRYRKLLSNRREIKNGDSV